jgi:hypothetical protein
MTLHHCRMQIALACGLALMAHYRSHAQSFTFDNIQFWVGTGANRAALVIDWQEDALEAPALAWGYRWDGTSRGSDMLRAIVSADDRLYAKLGGPTSTPNAVYGLGYDADGDGRFALDDGTTFNEEGIVFTSPADLATSIDPDDSYAEGWFTGFWHYGVETPVGTNPYAGSNWSDTAMGMAGRTLVDGSWDSWTFSPTFNFAAYAENPEPALPLFTTGDYTRDGRVDAADYARWRHSFGSTSDLAADGNHNGTVDAADYVLWRDHLTADATDSFATFVIEIPEPGTVSLLLFAPVPVLFHFLKPLTHANGRKCKAAIISDHWRFHYMTSRKEKI